jgi:hypothetical protein
MGIGQWAGRAVALRIIAPTPVTSLRFPVPVSTGLECLSTCSTLQHMHMGRCAGRDPPILEPAAWLAFAQLTNLTSLIMPDCVFSGLQPDKSKDFYG